MVLNLPCLHGMHVPPHSGHTSGELLPSISIPEKEGISQYPGHSSRWWASNVLEGEESISSASPPIIPCSIFSSSQEGPASADETIKDPAPEGHPVAGPAQLGPFVDGIRHAITLEGKAAHQPSQILAQTTPDGVERLSFRQGKVQRIPFQTNI